MEYILHKEIWQLLIGNISTFSYGVYKFCWLSQIWVVTLKHLFGQTIITRHVYPTGPFKLSNTRSLKNTSFFISPKCCFKWSGYCATSKHKTSCSAKVSFTLMCTSIHAAGKSAAALKDLKGPRTIPPHPLDEASVAPVSLIEWCVASYYDAPFIRWRASRHVWNSSDRPRPFWTVIMAAFTLSTMRRNFAMCLYIWYVYTLAGGMATDVLLHFPAKRSRFTKEIRPLVIAAVSNTSNLSNLPSETSKRRAMK